MKLIFGVQIPRCSQHHLTVLFTSAQALHPSRVFYLSRSSSIPYPGDWGIKPGGLLHSTPILSDQGSPHWGVAGPDPWQSDQMKTGEAPGPNSRTRSKFGLLTRNSERSRASCKTTPTCTWDHGYNGICHSDRVIDTAGGTRGLDRRLVHSEDEYCVERELRRGVQESGRRGGVWPRGE